MGREACSKPSPQTLDTPQKKTVDGVLAPENRRTIPAFQYANASFGLETWKIRLDGTGRPTYFPPHPPL